MNSEPKSRYFVAFCAFVLALTVSYTNCASFKVKNIDGGFYSKSSGLPELHHSIATVYFNDERDMKRIKKNYCNPDEDFPGVQSDEVYVDYFIDNLGYTTEEGLTLYCKLVDSTDPYTPCEEFYLQNQASISNYIQYDNELDREVGFIRYKYENLQNNIYKFDVYAMINEDMLSDVARVEFQICD